MTELIDFLPTSPNQPYDMKRIIAAVVDDGEYLEVHRHWAMSITCGFARMNGRVVGIVGNQPAVLAGRARHRLVGEGVALRARPATPSTSRS